MLLIPHLDSSGAGQSPYPGLMSRLGMVLLFRHLNDLEHYELLSQRLHTRSLIRMEVSGTHINRMSWL